MFCRYLMKKYSGTVTPAKAGNDPPIPQRIDSRLCWNDNFVFPQQGLIKSLVTVHSILVAPDVKSVGSSLFIRPEGPKERIAGGVSPRIDCGNHYKALKGRKKAICKKREWLQSLLLILLLAGVSEAADQPSGGTKKAAKKAELLLPLLREGFPVIDRKAKLVRHPKDNRWFLVFEPFVTGSSAKDNKKNNSNSSVGRGDLIKRTASVKPKPADRSVSDPESQIKDLIRGDELFTWPMEVLPGKWLTAMTRVTGSKVDLSTTFRVWGEVTVYRDRNFILPNLVATDSLFGRSVSKLSARKKKTTVGSLERALGGVNGKKSSDTNIKQTEEKLRMSEKLRNILLTVPRTHVLNLPEETREQETGQVKKSSPASPSGISIGAGHRGKWKDGSLIVDRVGRLTFDPQDGFFQFVFEADAGLAEPPIIIHPNLLLEEMENSTGTNITYRITGQVSKYRDKYYILMRKVLIRHGTGNLGK